MVCGSATYLFDPHLLEEHVRGIVAGAGVAFERLLLTPEGLEGVGPDKRVSSDHPTALAMRKPWW